MALGLKERYLKQEKSQKPQEEYKMKKNKKFSEKKNKKKTPKRGFFNSLNGKKVYIKLLSGEAVVGKLHADAYNKYDVEVYKWRFIIREDYNLEDLIEGINNPVMVIPKHAIALIIDLEGESQVDTKSAARGGNTEGAGDDTEGVGGDVCGGDVCATYRGDDCAA